MMVEVHQGAGDLFEANGDITWNIIHGDVLR